MVNFLEKHLDEEGLFRKTGSLIRQKELKVIVLFSVGVPDWTVRERVYDCRKKRERKRGLDVEAVAEIHPLTVVAHLNGQGVAGCGRAVVMEICQHGIWMLQITAIWVCYLWFCFIFEYEEKWSMLGMDFFFWKRKLFIKGWTCSSSHSCHGVPSFIDRSFKTLQKKLSESRPWTEDPWSRFEKHAIKISMSHENRLHRGLEEEA